MLGISENSHHFIKSIGTAAILPRTRSFSARTHCNGLFRYELRFFNLDGMDPIIAEIINIGEGRGKADYVLQLHFTFIVELIPVKPSALLLVFLTYADMLAYSEFVQMIVVPSEGNLQHTMHFIHGKCRREEKTPPNIVAGSQLKCYLQRNNQIQFLGDFHPLFTKGFPHQIRADHLLPVLCRLLLGEHGGRLVKSNFVRRSNKGVELFLDRLVTLSGKSDSLTFLQIDLDCIIVIALG
jgi:hypothetical protein